MKALRIFFLAAAVAFSSSVGADVVPPRPDGYTDSEDFGEVSFLTGYRTPDGIPFRRGLGPQFGVVSHGVEWAPKNLPVYLEIGRDARGTFVFLSTLIADREGRSRCWTEKALTRSDVATPGRLVQTAERELAAWAAACPAATTFGAITITSTMTTARRDFTRAYSKFLAARTTAYVAPVDSEGERELGVPSFLPDRISQPLLDAIADSCGMPRPQLRLQADGRIAVSRAGVGAETPSEASANSCVLRAVEYLPGMLRR